MSYSNEDLLFSAEYKADDRSPSSSSTCSSKPPAFTKVFDKKLVDADHFYLPYNPSPPIPRCTKIEGAEAWIWDDVLSEEECRLLRTQSEKAGYSYWDPESRVRDNFRSAFTVETHHPVLADLVYRRIEHFLPVINIDKESSKHEVDIEGLWYPCRVNSTWLFSRYRNGGHFAPHTDGCVTYDFNTRTMFTVLIYLNASPDGETRLFDDAQKSESFKADCNGKLRGNSEYIIASVRPEIGRVLCFYHTQMHEGNPADEKYIIRTDIVYERKPALCTEPEDVEAFQLYVEAQELSEQGRCDEAMPKFRRAFKISRALAKVYGQ